MLDYQCHVTVEWGGRPERIGRTKEHGGRFVRGVRPFYAPCPRFVLRANTTRLPGRSTTSNLGAPYFPSPQLTRLNMFIQLRHY
jgi:hypothetical protein